MEAAAEDAKAHEAKEEVKLEEIEVQFEGKEEKSAAAPEEEEAPPALEEVTRDELEEIKKKKQTERTAEDLIRQLEEQRRGENEVPLAEKQGNEAVPSKKELSEGEEEDDVEEGFTDFNELD